MEYRTESKNTTKFIDLHDCQCQHLNYRNSKLILKMDWMEILEEHPENPYDVAHSSDGGLIEFNDVIIIDCEIAGINFTNDIESKKYFWADDIEIYSYYENSHISLKYKYAEISGFTSDNEFINIEFLFKESCIKWNDLDDESWFARLKKTEDNVKDILKMLSWNNSKEVQEKGLKLASDIKYLRYLFQPFIDRESKSLWDNCAIVLSGKNDKELMPWLFQCFVLLQDMNWAGADKIFNRLSKYNDKEKLNHEKNKAIKIAKILNDDDWLKILYKI